MAQQSYQLINLNTNIDLLWPSSFGAPPYVLDLNDVFPDQDDHVIKLPRANLVSVGQTFIFNNVGNFDFAVNTFTGQQLPIGAAILPGEAYQFYLVDNTTEGGMWRLISYATANNSIVSFKSKSTDSSIVLNGVTMNPSITITNPGGDVDYTLPLSVSNLYKNITLEGFVAVTDTGPLTYASRTLVQGNNISIQNADGVVGNPIISVVDNINVDEIKVGTLQIQDDTITTTATDQDIKITTTGTGVVDINGVTFDSDGNINLNGGSITGVGSIAGLTNIGAYVNFDDKITGNTNTININNQVGITAVIREGDGTYKSTFSSKRDNQEYGVLVTTGSVINPGNLPVITHGYYVVKDEEYVTVIVTDASGELVLEAPNGVTVMVISS